MGLSPSRPPPARGEIGWNGIWREDLGQRRLAVHHRRRHGDGPGNDAARHRRGDRELLERLWRVVHRVRQRGDQGKAADLSGMVERGRERDRTTERMADHERAIQAQFLDESRHHIALGGQPRGSSGLALGVAGARTVEEDHPIVLPQTLAQPVGEMLHRGGKAVHQHDRLPLPLIDVVEARPFDIDEAADRRHRFLDAARDPGRKDNRPSENDDNNGDEPHENDEHA